MSRRPSRSNKKKRDVEGPNLRSYCPVVALGASAGGLEVFQQFFEAMPPESGMAFILVQHLDPDHDTLMPELLSKHTSMKVLRVEDGQKLEANHIYVIGPKMTLGVEGCTLRVSPAKPQGERNLIDEFFRKLAAAQRENVVGVVLSGTGSDGTLGLRAIKEQAGLTMAQLPATAKFDGMPQSAISTGCVDLVLPVAEMPARILEYVRHLEALHHRKGAIAVQQEVQEYLPRIFPILRRQTGHDFSRYKESTLVRRIQRRMQVAYLDSASKYVALLREKSEEVDALFKDLLIGVTQFFRDQEHFEALEKKVLPRLFQGKGADDVVRVWVPGCASGEEAYSVAILLVEHSGRLPGKPRIQIFATDLDGDALEIARKARYDGEIVKEVSSERLRRFFKRVGSGYEVVDEIRERCVFSPHNIIKDPPFSRLDLLSCRNVLIYLEAELQRKLLPLFHYSLNPSGYLFLGPSESIASRSELFRTIDPKHRIFQRKPTLLHAPVRVPVLDAGKVTRLQAPAVSATLVPKEQSLSRSIERVILEEYAPASVVINNQGEVLYFSGNTGKFLEPPAGVPNNRIVAMARRNLRLELRTAVHRAITTGKEVVRGDIRLKIGAETQQLDLVVRPLTELGNEPELFIVLFRELIPSGGKGRPALEALASQEHPVIKQLENELRTTKEDLQTTIEELETSNEELKSANEELLSMNEELQSANEELQTSKEEVQSANEELNRKIEEAESAAVELKRAHEDRAHLAAIVESSDDAIITKTLEGIITSWNKAAERMYGYTAEEVIGKSVTLLIPADRPNEEPAIIARLKRGEKIDHYETVRRRKDGTYLDISLTVSPIKDPYGVIVGASKTARDITGRKQAEEARLRLAAVVESSDDAIISKTLNGIVTSWNKGAERIFGYTAQEMIGKSITTIFPPDRLEEEARVLGHLRRGERLEHFETVRQRKDGQLIDISLTVSPIKDALGTVTGASKIARDITEQKRAERTVRDGAERLHLALMAGQLGDWYWEAATDVVTLSERAAEIFGLPPRTAITWSTMREMLHEADRERARLAVERALAERSQYNIEYRVTRPSGKECWIAAKGRGRYADDGRVVGMIGVVQDATERRLAEETLREERRVLEILNDTGKSLGSELDLQRLVQQVTDAATKLSGAKFGAFFYNVINEQGESFLLYTLSGAPREAFDKFGLPRATPLFRPTFHGERPVRCDDVTQDPRYGQMGPHHGMPRGHLPVRSYLAVPVISRSGEVIGALFFGHPEPGIFTERSERLVLGVAAQAAVAIDNARLYQTAQREIAERQRVAEALEKAQEELRRHAEHLEQQVASRTASLEEAVAQLEEFSYSVSHDLRAPLRAIGGYNHIIRKDFGERLPEGVGVYLDKIERNTAHMERLVNDVLTMSRVARAELRLHPILLQSFIEEIVEQHPPMQQPAAEVTIQAPHRIIGDDASLWQAISNLLSNAVKFVPPERKPVVRVRTEREGTLVRVWVEDNGIGIAERHRDKLFTMFQRLPARQNFEGTGIGLAIVRKAVERMGGTVGMEPNEPEGSRFWLQ